MHNNCVVSKRIVQNAQIAADFTNMFLYKFAVTPVWAYVLKWEKSSILKKYYCYARMGVCIEIAQILISCHSVQLRPYGRMY